MTNGIDHGQGSKKDKPNAPTTNKPETPVAPKPEPAVKPPKK